MTPLSQELIKKREELGWTVEDVAAKTRIRVQVLESIEQGNFNVLPAAYIRSYLKTYSHLVGLPEDEMIVLWNDSVPEDSDYSPAYDPAKHKSSYKVNKDAQLNGGAVKFSQPLIATMVYSAIALFVGVLAYYFFFRGDSSPTLSLRPSDMPDTSNISDDTAKPNGMLSYFNNAFPQDSIILEAHSSDTAWMTINMDGLRSQQITLTPTQQFRWAAKEYFILSLGNSGAITLKRNGHELQKFGQKGTIVRQVKINDKEIIASSEPYTPPAQTAQKNATTQNSSQKQSQSTNTTAQKTATTQSPSQKQSQSTNTTAQKNATTQNSSQKQSQSTNTTIQKPTTTVYHSTDSHTVKSKPNPSAKQQFQKKSVATHKNTKQKHNIPSSALQRILRNTSRENKKQRTEITPVAPVPASQSPAHYQPQPARPIDKKPDE